MLMSKNNLVTPEQKGHVRIVAQQARPELNAEENRIYRSLMPSTREIMLNWKVDYPTRYQELVAHHQLEPLLLKLEREISEMKWKMRQQMQQTHPLPANATQLEMIQHANWIEATIREVLQEEMQTSEQALVESTDPIQ
jgi:hypothetical protein